MIVDSTVAFKWIIVEEDSGAANALLERDDLVAPNLVLVELGNALWSKVHQGELKDRDVLPIHLAMAASLMRIVADADAIPTALDMALTLDHAIYDCVYLAFAARAGDVLITADRKFANKVLASPYAALVRLL